MYARANTHTHTQEELRRLSLNKGALIRELMLARGWAPTPVRRLR